MKERPILFSAPMVRALLDGTKTQTRRIVKLTDSGRVKEPGSLRNWHPEDPNASLASPYGQPGDRLWVKETWAAQLLKLRTVKPTEVPNWERINYAADHTADDMDGLGPWRPSLFMRRWMSRITLEVVSVRAERLQEITRGDCMVEGCPFANMAKGSSPKDWYRELWDSINAERAPWASNPWVWVVEFRKIEGGAQ
jgi:hypothetical protein